MTFRRKLKAGRTWKHPKIPISHLPEHILFEIIDKMKVKELVLMRQTSVLMNSVAMRHERRLASRPAVGTTLKISGPDIDAVMELSYNNTRSLVEGEFEREMAGISFETIIVTKIYKRPEVCLEIQKVLERLQPVCRWFSMRSCPWEFIAPITNCVTFEEEYDLTHTLYPQENWDSATAVACLASLKKAKNCSKFFMFLDEKTPITEGILDLVRDFSRICLYTDLQGFKEVLSDIEQSKEIIKLKTLQIGCDSYSPFDYEFNAPFQDISPPGVPPVVRLVTLPLQYVFFYESYRYWIYFTEKSAPAMEDLLLSFFAEHHGQFKSDVDDEDEDDYDDYEYYEDEKDEHKEHEKVEPRQHYRYLKRTVQSIVASIIQ